MLEYATRPIFYHDDDCDGTTSFVICYQFCKEGKGIPVKRSPTVSHHLAHKAEEYNADLVVILDKPRVESEFLNQLRVPILWIDHHEPQTTVVKPYPHVLYLNPRIWDDSDNRPTSYWAYTITQTNLWIATVGSIGDWFLPEYIEEFKKKYPDLVPQHYNKVEDLYLDTPIGTLIKVIQFNLKGQSTESRKSILTLSRIESPYEILQQTTAKGRFLWRKYETLIDEYNVILNAAKQAALQSGNILLYLYDDAEHAFTSELSNELMIRYPERVVFLGRKHDGFIKASVRSKNLEIPPILNEALQGCDGYGGGHIHACGVVVNENDWEKFYAVFEKRVNERMK